MSSLNRVHYEYLCREINIIYFIKFKWFHETDKNISGEKCWIDECCMLYLTILWTKVISDRFHACWVQEYIT